MWCSDRGIGGIEVSGAHMQWSATNGGTPRHRRERLRLRPRQSARISYRVVHSQQCRSALGAAIANGKHERHEFRIVLCAADGMSVNAPLVCGELKEHRSRERKELFACGLHGEKQQRGVEILPVKVPRLGDGPGAEARCSFSRMGRSVTFPLTPRVALAASPRGRGAGRSRIFRIPRGELVAHYALPTSEPWGLAAKYQVASTRFSLPQNRRRQRRSCRNMPWRRLPSGETL